MDVEIENTWFEIPENQEKIWPEVKKIFVQAFLNDDWIRWLYPDVKERETFITSDIQSRYEKGIGHGKGMFVVIKRRSKDQKESIIGGSCVSFGSAHFPKGDMKAPNLSIMERSRIFIQQTVFQPMKEIADQFETLLWYGQLQSIDPSLQNKSIGSKHLFHAYRAMLDKKLEQLKKDGILLKNPPLVFGISIHKAAARFSQRLGSVLVGYIPYHVEGYGVRHNYIFVTDLGNKDMIMEVRKKFKLIKPNL